MDNNVKKYADFIFEMKSDKEIVRDLARHLAFDKDVIKYLNTSRAKRTMGWRELLDTKLHGKNKDYINYLTKNMVADYNPQITGYIHINDDEEGDFDRDNEEEKSERDFEGMPLEDKLKDINRRIGDIEELLGIDPDDEKTLKSVADALDDIGYERPEQDDDKEIIEKELDNE